MKFPQNRTANKNKISETGSVIHISKDLNKNIAKIENDFDHSNDLEVNYYKFDNIKDLVCASLYIKSLVDKSTIKVINAKSVIKASLVNRKPAVDVEINVNQNIGAVKGEFDVSKEENLNILNELAEKKN